MYKSAEESVVNLLIHYGTDKGLWHFLSSSISNSFIIGGTKENILDKLGGLHQDDFQAGFLSMLHSIEWLCSK